MRGVVRVGGGEVCPWGGATNNAHSSGDITEIKSDYKEGKCSKWTFYSCGVKGREGHPSSRLVGVVGLFLKLQLMTE